MELQQDLAAGARVKEQGLDNDLIERLVADPQFGLSEAEIRRILDPSLYIGRCPEQVDRFLRDFARPAIEPFRAQMNGDVTLKV